MLVKFSTFAGGVFIEAAGVDEYQPSARCFRFDERGYAEYAIKADLEQNGERARWFGHVLPASEFMFA